MSIGNDTCYPQRRRALVAAQVAILLVVLLGFAALAVDMGVLYNTKTELQQNADASALAAASMLAEYSTGDPVGLAKSTAASMSVDNEVMGQSLTLDSSTDIVLGRANYDEGAGGYTFTPTEVLPDAVQITVRKTSDSANGAVNLFFAKALGLESANLEASAVAMMVPRDIAIVADLSASHTDDCEFRQYTETDICLYDVWDAFPGGLTDNPSTWTVDEFPSDPAQTAGPGWGHLRKFGFGTNPITTSYNPTSDSGLVRLSKGSTWTNATITAALTAQGYTSSERSAIMSSANDGTTSYYDNRTAVALGLAQWNSGMTGGLWSQTGQPAGNNNTIVGSGELTWLVPLLGDSVSDSSSIWLDYVSYMRGTSSAMYSANSSFRYRYGIKTVVNYLMEKRPSYTKTPEFISTPTQPMQAVKDAVTHLSEVLYELETDDMLSLEIYGTTAYHEVDLTKNYVEVSDRLNEMSAGYYDSNTNIGGGIAKAIEELTGPHARSISGKTIFLLTDGIANIDADGDFTESGGTEYALEQAQAAADLGIRIFAVSVGSNADTDFMAEVAEIGKGEHFHAGADMTEYVDELEAIFEKLGGTRPVELIK